MKQGKRKLRLKHFGYDFESRNAASPTGRTRIAMKLALIKRKVQLRFDLGHGLLFMCGLEKDSLHRLAQTPHAGKKTCGLIFMVECSKRQPPQRNV